MSYLRQYVKSENVAARFEACQRGKACNHLKHFSILLQPNARLNHIKIDFQVLAAYQRLLTCLLTTVNRYSRYQVVVTVESIKHTYYNVFIARGIIFFGLPQIKKQDQGLLSCQRHPQISRTKLRLNFKLRQYIIHKGIVQFNSFSRIFRCIYGHSYKKLGSITFVRFARNWKSPQIIFIH